MVLKQLYSLAGWLPAMGSWLTIYCVYVRVHICCSVLVGVKEQFLESWFSPSILFWGRASLFQPLYSILQANWPTRLQADFLFASYLIIKVLGLVHQLSTCVPCVSRIKTLVIRLAEQAFSLSKSSPWP